MRLGATNSVTCKIVPWLLRCAEQLLNPAAGKNGTSCRPGLLVSVVTRRGHA